MASINIGKTLQKARIDQKISLDELQQRTKIQKRYLIALEDNDFQSLPSDYYLRAFIRQYAEEVKLDGNYLLDVYDGKDQPQPVYPEIETVEGSRRNKHVESPTKKRIKASLPTVLLGLVALSIVVVVGYMMWLDNREAPIISPNNSMAVENSVSASESTLESTSESSSTVESTSESSKEPEKPKMAITMENNTTATAQMRIDQIDGPVKLSFTGKERVWVGVQVNGALIYQYTLQPNETQTTELPANTAQAMITVGIADYASIEVNDEPLDFQPAGSLSQKNINLTMNYVQ
ncbi:RodZ domain-containing protein [Enterococcus sp. AZ109]|uniref:helix-turn-helix domain-containing protein n=1 Tax=Enterococcus sp. AZ109 TaxID=2774634 RepID=UPI003F270FD9